jgi:hypothetical protein
MNIIMQRFAVVTMIFAPLTLLTGFFGKQSLTSEQLGICLFLLPLHEFVQSFGAGMNVPIPGPSMNLDEHDG